VQLTRTAIPSPFRDFFMLRRTLCARTFIRRTAMSFFDNLRSTRSASERVRCKLDDVLTVELGPQTGPSWDVVFLEGVSGHARRCQSSFVGARSRLFVRRARGRSETTGRRIPVWLSRRLHFKWVSDGIAALEKMVAPLAASQMLSYLAVLPRVIRICFRRFQQGRC
jgi:hypothetical protein